MSTQSQHIEGYNKNFDGVVYRTKITGRAISRNGLKYSAGEFDILCRKIGEPYKRMLVSGKITEYNGIQYGINGKLGCYKITHIPTGYSINDWQILRTLEDVANYISSDKVQVTISDLIKEKASEVKEIYSKAIVSQPQ